MMTTHFISAEVDLQDSPLELQQAIDTELRQQGEPLRWAVTETTDTKATVEAVVLVETDTAPAG